jgi:hypothetical protein
VRAAPGLFFICWISERVPALIEASAKLGLTMQLRFGERTRLACCSRRPAENIVRTDESLYSELLLRPV